MAKQMKDDTIEYILDLLDEYRITIQTRDIPVNYSQQAAHDLREVKDLVELDNVIEDFRNSYNNEPDLEVC